jgi:hypothetical protein
MRGVLLLLLLATGSASAADYYFSTSGSTANPCTAVAPCPKPRGMRGYADNLPQPKAGDRFIFKGGDTWTDELNILTAEYNGTTLMGGAELGFGAGRAVIAIPTLRSDGAIHIEDASNITVRMLSLSNAMLQDTFRAGFVAINSSAIKLERNEFTASINGVIFNNCDSCVAIDNDIHDNTAPNTVTWHSSGVFIYGGSDDAIINENRIRDNGIQSVESFAAGPVQLLLGGRQITIKDSNRVTVTENEIRSAPAVVPTPTTDCIVGIEGYNAKFLNIARNSFEGGSFGEIKQGADDLTIESNTGTFDCVGMMSIGKWQYTGVPPVNSLRTVIANNTFVQTNNNAGSRVGVFSSPGVTLRNNVFVFPAGYTGTPVIIDCRNEVDLIDTCTYPGDFNGMLQNNVLPVTSFAMSRNFGVSSAQNYTLTNLNTDWGAVGNIQSNVTVGGLTYALTGNSPAIGIGQKWWASGKTPRDKRGHALPDTGAIDAGAVQTAWGAVLSWASTGAACYEVRWGPSPTAMPSTAQVCGANTFGLRGTGREIYAQVKESGNSCPWSGVLRARRQMIGELPWIR